MDKLNKDDLEIISEVFNTLNHAKFKELDGDGVISVYRSFVNLRKLEKKISDIIKEEETKPKKKSSVRKKKTKAKEK